MMQGSLGSSDTETIQVSSLPNGMYLLILMDKNGNNVAINRLIKN